MRSCNVVEGETALVEQWLELVCRGELAGLGENFAVVLRMDAVEHAGEHEDRVQRQALGVHGREIGLVLRHDGRDLAVDPRAGERGGDIRTAGRIEDHVEAAPAGQAFDIVFDAFLAIVDDVVGAHTPRDIGFRGRRYRGRNARALGLGQLDGDMTHAAGAAVDEHVIARHHARAIHHRFPGRDRDQRQGGGFAPVERLRLEGHEGGVDHDVFAVGPAATAQPAGTAIDRVAFLQPRDAFADRFDHARHVAAEHARQLGRDGGTGGAQLGIDRVHARRDLAHQNLAGAGGGRIDIGGLEDIGCAEFADELNLHGWAPGNG